MDGNKRTAFVSVVVILRLNRYLLMADQKDVVKFMLKMAHKKTSIEEISLWLKKHSKKI